MKKTLSLLLVLVSAALLLSSCGQKIGGMKYKVADGEVIITGYSDKTTVTEVTIPDEIDSMPVTEVADFGICNAESLIRITIGKNVKKINGWSFTNNQHLTEFVVDPANEYFTAADGVLFSKDMKTLYYYPGGRGITFDKYGQAQNSTEYAIPDGVETVAGRAFYKCYYTDITYFPDSIKVIEEKAFHRCSSLTDFDVPASLEFIGKDAFAYDDKLTELTLPAGVREIGEYAFFNCTGMKKITVLAKEADLTLGKKWQPTEKGRVKADCEIVFG